MSHDEIDDWYYDDNDEDDVRTFDPNAVYRNFVDNIDDFDDEHDFDDVDEEEEDDQLEGFDDEDDEMELEAVDDSSFYDEE